MKLININKSFKELIVLENLNFEANKNELIYIKGINGSGKSTLLKIIAGIIEADTGEVIIEPFEEIGGLIENPGFIENETAAFNMRFLYELNHQYDEQRVSQLFSMFGLDLNSKKIVSKYSVGMRQKLGIIQAVMEDQNLLLFDEPTRGLDENSVAVFTNMINQYAKEGKCIIICAHDGVDGIEFTKKMELKNGTLKVLEN